MIAEIGEVFSAQKDGAPPTILASGRAPGESGVSVVSLRFQGSAHFSAYLRQHLVAFISKTRIKCRLARTCAVSQGARRIPRHLSCRT